MIVAEAVIVAEDAVAKEEEDVQQTLADHVSKERAARTSLSVQYINKVGKCLTHLNLFLIVVTGL
jgi:mannose/fructose/N-acetylgalactosamine-specific phosphotransferase system component IIB